MKSESQDEHDIHVEDEEVDTTMESEHLETRWSPTLYRVVVTEENRLPLALSNQYRNRKTTTRRRDENALSEH